MAEHLHIDRCDCCYHTVNATDRATHVAWHVDDLPGLAADIHRTVADLLLHGPGGDAIDAAILDRLRGTTARAADDAALPG